MASSEISNEKSNESQIDLINRRDAIDAIRAMQTYKLFAGDDMRLVNQAEAMTELMMLPSAQPEIIRCRDCKYAINIGTPDMMCKNRKAWVVATENYFGCVFAERRTDE